VDTLRADELGAYGAEPSRTPALDRLAERSVVFERAHAAASWTLPSLGAVFTSFFPSTTRLWSFESRLADSFVTLAERFQAAGFDTHGIASHVYFQAKYGLLQGFDTFDDELCHRKGEEGWRSITSPAVSARAVRWLEERARSGAREPWLLFAHYFDPHLDYLDHEAQSPADETRPERERYRSEIGFTDGHVGTVLDTLERTGFGRDTVVLFFSDHGESFLEHPPIQRHSWSLPDEDARLREGLSLLPLLEGRARPAPPNLAEIRLKERHHANALVRGGHKLYEDVSGRRLLLFDLEADPRERSDLSTERPALLAELEAELRARVRAAEAKGARFADGGSVEHTPEELEHLRQLGYAGDEGPGEARRGGG
jgi:arylsulfatase A-like enzyme